MVSRTDEIAVEAERARSQERHPENNEESNIGAEEKVSGAVEKFPIRQA